MPQTIVFCGPSLPPEDRTPYRGFTYARPASRGDIEAASQTVHAILLIDGVFHHDLAPSPKECYAAAQRTRCFGAASMGALRAAECARFGFLPLGAIALWYAREVLDGDDEVALLTHPHSDRALTVPSVNVRFVAWLARRRGILSPRDAARFVADAREIFYMDRSWDDVLACVAPARRSALAAIVAESHDLKRMDARFALRSVARRLGVGLSNQGKPPLGA